MPAGHAFLYTEHMSVSTLAVKVSEDDGATIVVLRGDGGVPNVDVLTRALLPLTARHPKVVIFDLAELTFISSLLMGELVQFHRGLTRHGGKVRLIAPQEEVLKALQHARLDLVFDIDAT
jgi:anti-anti-sigma factor